MSSSFCLGYLRVLRDLGVEGRVNGGLVRGGVEGGEEEEGEEGEEDKEEEEEEYLSGLVVALL